MPDPIIPGARLELLAENDTQPRINPTQIIMHTAKDGQTTQSLTPWWDQQNLESHGYITRYGVTIQNMKLNIRADANNKANARAISFESWDGSAGQHYTPPWTDAQVDEIVRVLTWICDEWGIPKRLCNRWDAPGIGYHRQYPEWSVGGTSCPGDARIDQLINHVLPRVQKGSAPTRTPLKEQRMFKYTNGYGVTEQVALFPDGKVRNCWMQNGQFTDWREDPKLKNMTSIFVEVVDGVTWVTGTSEFYGVLEGVLWKDGRWSDPFNVNGFLKLVGAK